MYPNNTHDKPNATIHTHSTHVIVSAQSTIGRSTVKEAKYKRKLRCKLCV